MMSQHVEELLWKADEILVAKSAGISEEGLSIIRSLKTALYSLTVNDEDDRDRLRQPLDFDLSRASLDEGDNDDDGDSSD